MGGGVSSDAPVRSGLRFGMHCRREFFLGGAPYSQLNRKGARNSAAPPATRTLRDVKETYKFKSSESDNRYRRNGCVPI
uniref:Uncharacterized protein n=1 Tax=Mycena chlorophos TaxID=658473 RepID=A0ABQ0LF45_MYCCL|nr:predicted protein [Mycena chlorophos]